MMTDEDYKASGKKRKSRGIAPYLPILGLILAIALGAISYVLGEPVANIVAQSVYFPDFEAAAWIMRVIIFVILLLIVGMLYAMAAPKKAKAVTERDLNRERRAATAEKEARRKTKRKANKKMAKDLKEKSK